VNLLVTSSRMPFALDEIRKFGRRGHRVFAADSFPAAPGSHSRYVAAHMIVAPPQRAPMRFLSEVKQIIQHRAVDVVVPCFEEAFYLARHLPELSAVTHLFTSIFDVLSRLHSKWQFNRLAGELGIDAPETLLVESDVELDAALRAWPRYVARPAWSRGGLHILTNVAPLAGAVARASCRPTPQRPWIVQPYVDGIDLCTFSVANHGRVTVHCSYVHPIEIEHAGGIVFESVVEPTTLAVSERIVEATGYHGQIGVDFRRTASGKLVVLECNPRPTAGVHLVPDQVLVDAVLAKKVGRMWVVPAGVKRKYASAVLRDLVLHGARLHAHLAVLLSRSVGDVYRERGDWLPALYQVISYAYVSMYRMRNRHLATRRGTSLMAAYFDGIAWNGEPIP
jgi:predicted ATP-grasp superfamily ATP-dependent carboligase